MEIIPVGIDLEEVLNGVDIEKIIKFYGAKKLLDGIETSKIIEIEDPDIILESIDSMYPKKIVEYLQENGIDNFLNEIDDDIIIKHAIQIREAGD